MKKLVCSVLFAATAAGSAFAITKWVDPAAPDGGDGSESSPYNDLYFAITNLIWKTSSTDTVILKPGTYRLADCYPEDVHVISVEFNVWDSDPAKMIDDKRNKPLVIRGASSNCRDVVIDGCGSKCFFKAVRSGITELYNVTVSNCFTTSETAAVANGNKVDNVISNCVFTHCVNLPGVDREIAGGGLELCNGKVFDCLFQDCMTSNTMESGGRAFGGGSTGRYGSPVYQGCIYRRCRAFSSRDTAVSGWSVCGSGGGGGAFYYAGGTFRNCYFDDCTAVGRSTAQHIYGGALCAAGSATTDCCFFTNCSSSVQGGAIGGGVTKLGCTIVDCCATNYSAQNSGGGRNMLYLKNTSTGNGACYGANFYDCVFRGNAAKTATALYCRAEATVQNISNCVFALNTCTGNNIVSLDGWQKEDLSRFDFADCIFRDNGTGGHGTLEIGYTGSNAKAGVRMRNCLFNGYDQYGVLVYVNQNNMETPAIFENCSFIRRVDMNRALAGYNNTGYKNMFFRNCFFYNKRNTLMLPTQLATMGNVTNCVFSNDAGVNLAPEYANRVMTLAQMKLADAENDDWRPTRTSPLRDACTNGFDVAWAPADVKACKTAGSYDIGDGTWTETPYATVTACAGMAEELTFDTGVVITRNNVNPRRYNNYLDVGCFEYYAAPGLMLLVK